MPGLTLKEVEQFQNRGYLVLPGFFDASELEPVICEFAAAIDQLARNLKARGVISSLHEEADFQSRFAKLAAQSPEVPRALFPNVPQGPEFFALLGHNKILNAVESLVGSEIVCHPGRYIRGKLPHRGAPDRMGIVPWHQDSAYLAQTCDDHLIVTFWTALTETTVENGCLEIEPYAHKQGLLPHRNLQNRFYVDIPESSRRDVETVLVPAKPGDAVLMTNLTPHRSGPNHTQRIRWSFDSRYHHVDTPSGFPSKMAFLIRSRSNPKSAVTSFAEFESSQNSFKPRAAARWRWPQVRRKSPDKGPPSS